MENSEAFAEASTTSIGVTTTSPSKSNSYFATLAGGSRVPTKQRRSGARKARAGMGAATTCQFYSSEAGCRFGNRCRALHVGAPTKPVRLDPRELMVSEDAALRRFVADRCIDPVRFEAMLEQLTPSPLETAERRRVLDSIRVAFKPFLVRALAEARRDIRPASAAPQTIGLQLFGSTFSGLWMPSSAGEWAALSDMDLALVASDEARRRAQRWWASEVPASSSSSSSSAAAPRVAATVSAVHDLTTCAWSNRWWARLHRAAHKAGAMDVVLIASATMPVLKLRWPLGAAMEERSIAIDVTLGNCDAVAKTAFVRAIVRCDDRIAPLIRVVKCWAQQHGAQSADPSDGLNSFALTLLIFHWMQRCEPRPMLPPLRPLFAALAEEPELPLDAAMGELGVAPSHCKGSVAELLHRFVRYYATVCPATRGGGSAVPYVLRLLDVDRDGEQFEWPGDRVWALGIEDPITVGVNPARSCHDMTLLRFTRALHVSVGVWDDAAKPPPL